MIAESSGHHRRWFAGVLVVAATAASVGPSMGWVEPPRYDGAGYATLAKALLRGSGYRDVGHPDAPPHAHFPPGYPAALAMLWAIRGGVSITWAHGFSAACTLIAAWATWRWWRSAEPAGVASTLGLALAINWAWGRIGGTIQSEPMFMALIGLALLVSVRAGRSGSIRSGLTLGVVLGAAILTRHVGACLAIAMLLDLAIRRQWRAVVAASVASAVIVAPWVGWQAWVGSGSQAGLFRPDLIAGTVAGQVLFYARRIPDQVAGPLVEAATVFGRSRPVAVLATVAAVVASAVVGFGWCRMLGNPRRRVGGLVPIVTMLLLLAWPFTEAGRFLVPMVPFLLMGAVEGLAALLNRWRVRRSRVWAARMVLAASIPYSVYAIVADRAGAQRRAQSGFDSASGWIASRGDRPGPILARHPSDAAWLSGRTAMGVPAEVDAIDALIRTRGIAYLLVDEDRYANAPPSPLRAYVDRFPARIRLAHVEDEGRVAVFTIIPGAN